MAQTSWDFLIEDDKPWTLSIQTLVHRPKSPVIVQSVNPPPRLKAESREQVVLRHTQTSTAESKPDKAKTKKKDENERQRSRSPHRGEAAEEGDTQVEETTTMEVDQVGASGISTAVASVSPLWDPSAAVEAGWQELDLGGCGDCLFRCLAAHKLLEESKEATPAATKTPAALLRTDALKHIRKHRQRFETFWAPSPNAAAEGKPATFDQWLEKAAMQSTYGNGVFLQALSERMGSAFVVWKKQTNENNETIQERFVIAPRFDSAGVACKAPSGWNITLLLENKHYKLLTKPKEASVPRSWLKETVTTLISLDGGSPTKEVQLVPSPPGSSPRQPRSPMSSVPTPSVRTQHGLVSSTRRPVSARPKVAQSRNGSSRQCSWAQPPLSCAPSVPSVHTQVSGSSQVGRRCPPCPSPGRSVATPSVHSQGSAVSSVPCAVARRLTCKTPPSKVLWQDSSDVSIPTPSVRSLPSDFSVGLQVPDPPPHSLPVQPKGNWGETQT